MYKYRFNINLTPEYATGSRNPAGCDKLKEGV
jgi:hypothetical protein